MVVIKPAWSTVKAANGPSNVKGWILSEEHWTEYNFTGVKLYRDISGDYPIVYGIQLQWRNKTGATIYSDLIKSKELLPEAKYELKDIQLVEGAEVS